MSLPSVSGGAQQHVYYAFGPFRVDPVERQLIRDGQELRLTGKAFDVLLVLVRSGGRTLTKEEFLSLVWPDVIVDESSLTGNISIVRQVLGDDAREPRYIQTVARRGYRFVAPVTEIQPRPDGHVLVSDERRTRVVIEEQSDDRRLPKSAVWYVTAVVAMTVIAAVAAMRQWSGAPAPGAKRVGAEGAAPAFFIPLTNSHGDEFSPALSPDGRFVAFARAADDRRTVDLFVKQTAVGSAIQLTHSSGRDGGATWSPDSQYIAFWRLANRSGDGGIFIIPALGGTERRIVTLDFPAGRVSWSPGGKTLAYAAKESHDAANAIWLVDIETHEKRRLTTPPVGTYGDYDLAFSPDGRQIAFARGDEGAAKADLYLVDVAGGGLRRLTNDERKIRGLAWDGDQIIVSSLHWGNHRLTKIPVAGGTPSPVEPVVEHALDPSIASQPRLLAFTKIRSDVNIYSVDLTTKGKSESLLLGSTRYESFPRLSPDGKRIAFESDRGGNRQIWVGNADGSDLLQLTSQPEGAETPSWSPDGRTIAFVSAHNVYVIPSDGGAVRRLDTRGAACVAPSWSRDGSAIYYGGVVNGGIWQVWRVPVAGGAPAQVTRDGGYESAESADGRWLYYNKRGLGRLGLFRQPAGGGMEEMIHALPQLGSFGDWHIVDDGIYFVHRYDAPGQPASPQSIRFFDFETRRTTEVARLQGDPGPNPGLSTTRDGRRAIYSRIASYSSDLMLIKNFR